MQSVLEYVQFSLPDLLTPQGSFIRLGIYRTVAHCVESVESPCIIIIIIIIIIYLFKSSFSQTFCGCL